MLRVPDETALTLRCFRDAGLAPNTRILDVGCGYGRFMRKLSSAGYTPVGVEVNEDAVASNRAAGFECVTPDDWKRGSETFDAMLFSHIVEHFEPGALLQLLDLYLDRLVDGGSFVIVTPCLWDGFYRDFDHVKPYHPRGFQMVFGAATSQVQYQSRNVGELTQLKFRRRPWLGTHRPYMFLARSTADRLKRTAFARGMSLLFHASRGYFGQTDGWVGLFQKQGQRSS